ncbi:MAG: SufS family cysteine desulfurase [Actinobacteria bacterium]|nr:MAG: SufS family cysteine desulfurase [Actinomycetota bacterium]
MQGKIVKSGGPELAHELEDKGYEGVRRELGKVHGRPLVYLDNAATSQKPQCVIDGEARYYAELNANIHRGVHALSQQATDAYEAARDTVRRFINAARREEIVFVRGTTEAVNLVAASWGQRLQPGDEILITEMEHHSNIVPWQLVAQATGAKLRYLGLTDDGLLDLSNLGELLGDRTKILGVTAMSNALGTITPLKQLVDAAHAVGAIVVVDAAQAAPHMPFDMDGLEADFLAFSGHKMLGPTASGGLLAKREHLDRLQPMFGGGDMIREVFHDHATWNDVPYRFEAGTMQVAQQVGLAAACDYLDALGMEAVRAHEVDITRYAIDRLLEAGAVVYGPKDTDIRGGTVSFWYHDIHPHDLATILNEEGIAVRAGHHCAQLVMRRYGTPATVRASFYVYNTNEEVDLLVASLARAGDIFAS